MEARLLPVIGQAASPTTPPTTPLTMLATLQQADLVVRGRVLAVKPRWAAEQRMIESVVTVQVRETMRGAAKHLVTLVAAGGYLAEEGLGMISPHGATFVVGEEVLLFLRQQEMRWRVVGGAAGKFSVQGADAVSQDWAMATPLAALVSHLSADELRHESEMSKFKLQQLLHPGQPSLPARPTVLTSASPASMTWPGPNAEATYYLNTRSQLAGQGNAASERAVRIAIVAAATRWSAVQEADFTLRYGGTTTATTTGYNGANEILFVAKGHSARAAAAEVWYRADGTIVEADIWINDDYTWAVADEPAAEQLDLQSALLHEFGHWLILDHSPERASIMYPKLAAGRVKRTLHHLDQAGISAIYPR